MKVTKKLLAFLMALVMVMGLGLTASAANITINNAADGETYTAYKLFDVSTNENGTSYSYYIENTEGNKALIQLLDETIGLNLTLSADGTRYNVNTQGTEDTAVFQADNNATMTAADLAVKLAENETTLASATSSKSAVADNKVATITDLDDGYYFINTTMGSLCILNTTDQNIMEKNEAPEVEKDVTTPTDNDTVQIGDTVDFTITVTAKKGAEGYVLHDQMSDGLTLIENSIAVKVGEDALTVGTDYTVNTNPEENADDPNCVFEITFKEEYLNAITEDTVITVTYQAVVNEKAVVGTDPITNKAILDYGDNSHVDTDEGKTEIYTYDFVLTKTDSSEDPQILTGAEFKLYSSEEGEDAIQFVYDEDNATYRVATAEEISSGDISTTDTIKVGTATITGLAGKSYWLEETKAPDGYHKLEDRVEVRFVTQNDEGESLTLAQSNLEDTAVKNEAGALLPSTGGMGTTVIYIIGAVLVIGAGIILVVRRRRNA